MIPVFSLTLSANSNFCFYSCSLYPKLVIMSYRFDCCNIFRTGLLNSIVIPSTLVSIPQRLTAVSLPTVYPTSFSLKSIQNAFVIIVSLEHSADPITILFKNQTFYDTSDPLILRTKWQSPPPPFISETPLKPFLLRHHKPYASANWLSLCVYFIPAFVLTLACVLPPTESPCPLRPTSKAASVESSLSGSLPQHWNPRTFLFWAVLPVLSLALCHLYPMWWPE